jgi:hypothetical protein
MGKWDFLKKVGKTAGQAALQGAVASNTGIALAVQVAQASINNEQADITGQVATLNSILAPHGFVIVRTTPPAVP